MSNADDTTNEGTPVTTALTEMAPSDGKLTRQNYKNFIKHRLHDYSQIKLNAEEIQKVHRHLLKLSTGASAMIPLYCGGNLCPFKRSCVFYEMGKAPVNLPCLIETQLLEQWTIDYMEEFDVDPQNMTEVAYANELAELMVMERRLNMNIAKVENAELVVDTPMGVDREGDPIVQKQISPFVELKDKLASRRSKIIKLMVGDRQEKYKKEAALKIKEDKDPSSQHAEMRAKLDELQRQLQKTQQAALPAGSPPPQTLSPEDIIDAEEDNS